MERVITKICKQAWEKEVDKKKGKHSVNWLLGQANNMHMVRADPKDERIADDCDDEPVSVCDLNDRLILGHCWLG